MEEYRRKNPRMGVITKEGIEIGRGDRKVVVPQDEVEKLARLWCSYSEIAEWFGIPVESLKYNFKDVIDRGRSETRQALRKAQLKSALGGNVTMMIWLGKNILAQSDTLITSDATLPLPWSDDPDPVVLALEEEDEDDTTGN